MLKTEFVLRVGSGGHNSIHQFCGGLLVWPPRGSRSHTHSCAHALPERGEGGSHRPHVKTRPSDERSPDTAPPRSDSNQKGYTYEPKTHPIQTRHGTLNPDDPRPTPFTRTNEKPGNRYKRPRLQAQLTLTSTGYEFRMCVRLYDISPRSSSAGGSSAARRSTAGSRDTAST